MILRRPFLVTIHAEIDVFIKEISLGIGDDRVTFNMDKKIHNFTTPIGKIYMINLIHNDESPSRSNAPSDKSSRMNEEGFLKLWYCYLDGDRESIKGSGLSFPEFLLVKYGEAHKKELFWDNRPKDYPFKDWLLIKVGLIDGNNTYWWHDHGLEENERQEAGLKMEDYTPPKVHVETFEIKRYSFDIGQSFICINKGKEDTLLIGRENESRFREMIRKEVKIQKKTFSQQGIGIQGLLDSLSCVIPGDTRLLNRSFVRIHLLQLSFKVESNA
ncbi:hypothetical protein Tco_0138068 [Tanacetum coccineum]